MALSRLASRSVPLSKPITGIAGCCARAASGHATAELPRSAMNSRRLMGLTPRPRITKERVSVALRERGELSGDEVDALIARPGRRK